LKLVEREQLLQQEHIKKRIADRKRISSQNRSVSSITMANQLGSLLGNYSSTGVKKVAIDLQGSDQIFTQSAMKQLNDPILATA